MLLLLNFRWKPHNEERPKCILLSIDSEGSIIYWHTATGKILHKISELTNPLLCLDYNNEGTQFAIGCENKEILIFDEDMKFISSKFKSGSKYIPGHQSRINSVCFDKNDSNVLVSGGWDQTIYKYDLRVSKIIINFSDKVTGSLFGPYLCGDALSIKDNVLLSGSYSGSTPIQLWDLRTMKLLENIKWDELNDHIETNIFSVQFNKNKGKNLFAVGSSNTNHVRIYDMDKNCESFAALKYLDKPIYSLDFSNNGEYLAYAGAESNINIISL